MVQPPAGAGQRLARGLGSGDLVRCGQGYRVRVRVGVGVRVGDRDKVQCVPGPT